MNPETRNLIDGRLVDAVERRHLPERQPGDRGGDRRHRRRHPRRHGPRHRRRAARLRHDRLVDQPRVPRALPDASSTRRSRNAKDELREIVIAEAGSPIMLTYTVQCDQTIDWLPFFADLAGQLRVRAADARHAVHGHAEPPPAAARGGRRGRRDHAVELPAVPEPLQARTGARGRLHRGAEAGARHAVVRDHARPPDRRAHRHSRRRRQRRRQLRSPARRDARHRSARRRGDLHRLDRDRPARDGERRRDGEEGLPRARRQVGDDHARRRRPAERARQHRRRCARTPARAARITTRLLLPRSRYAEGVELATEAFQQLHVRRPDEPGASAGSARSASASASACSATSRRPSRKARGCVVGGGVPKHLPKGYYVEPTLFVDVDPKSTLAQEEVFGPVLAVIPFEDDDDAVRIANDSIYGLSGAVTSASEERALAVARRIRTGTLGDQRRHVVRRRHAVRRLPAERRRPRERRRRLRGVPRDQGDRPPAALRRSR